MSVKRFFELQDEVLSYYPDANAELLKKAYSISVDAHIYQECPGGEPYIIHPLAVASILADMKLDEITIAAERLHDVVEASDYTIDKVESFFNKEIRDIVWGVTKIAKLQEREAAGDT